MSNIIGVLARVTVDDLDAALPFYQHVTGGGEPHRFTFRDLTLARVGPFLLISGNTQAYADRTATLLVQDLAPVISELTRTGGEVLEGPAPGPNGRRLIARHPDGSSFEYIELA